MAAANASARGQRAAILASPLHELTGFYLAVDCLAPGCHGERSFAVAELASFYGQDGTVGLGRMRCSVSIRRRPPCPSQFEILENEIDVMPLPDNN